MPGKAPAFQFYVRDWLSDPQLRMASFQSKGIWMDLLCLLWESPERGILVGAPENIRQMIGCNEKEFDQFIKDASVTKFADVTFCNGIVTIKNRRMWRDEKVRHDTKLRVKRFREKRDGNEQCNANVTNASSSSSSCTKVQEALLVLPDWLDCDLWKDFLEHRKKLRKPMTDRAQDILLKKLSWLRDQGHNPRYLLMTSIERGWLSVFAPKEDVNG